LARNPNKQGALKRQCEVSWLSRLDALARSSGDWRAYAWLLERNFPHSYALFTVQRQQISVSMKLDEKVQMVSEAELIEMHQAAAEGRGPGAPLQRRPQWRRLIRVLGLCVDANALASGSRKTLEKSRRLN